MTNDTLENKKRAVRLLLVEDNHGDSLLMTRAFERTQIETHITLATTGEEACSILDNCIQKHETPDIILLDLNLPGISGIETLKRIKKNEQLKKIPVIILSSSRAEYDVINCYNNHANCYMKKASNLEELYELTHKIEEFWFKQVILPDEKNNHYGV